jgi:hypothetical protein
LKSIYPEQIKHFVFLSLFLTRLSEYTPFGEDDDGEEEMEEGEGEGEDGKRCGRNKES